MNASDEPLGNAAPPAAAPPAGAAPPAPGPPPAAVAEAGPPAPGQRTHAAAPVLETTGPFDPRRKSPALACILSIMPGLGQIYVGYYKLGFIHAIVFGTTIVFLANELFPPLIPLMSIFLGFFYLYNVVDAGRRAAFYNQALGGKDLAIQMPSDLTLPSPGGSVVGGVVLVVVGLVLLSNTMLGIPWYWLEEWWPVAPIAFGIYLVVRGMKEKAEREAAGKTRDDE